MSKDLDIVRPVPLPVEEFEAELTVLLSTGWNGFRGRLIKDQQRHPPDVPPQYLMMPYRVKLEYMSIPFKTITVELAHDEVGSTAYPDLALDDVTAELLVQLGFPAPDPVQVMAVEHQIAQKLHACTTSDGRGRNERAHDLVDIQILWESDAPDLAELHRVGRRLFSYRGTTQWPPEVRAHDGWDELYAAAAEGLDVRGLTEALQWINDQIAKAVAASRGN
jgi:hypothetical protein